MVSAGVVMGIDVVDHIILGERRYCSLLEVGAIPKSQ
jgi:DNA repair protein RadC